MRIVLIAILCLSFLIHPVFAHPHIFITPQVVIKLDGQLVSQINVEWYLDEMSTMMIVEGFGTNNMIGPDEAKAIRDWVLSDAQKSNYYTYLVIDGKPVQGIVPSDFKVGLVSGNRLCYTFTLDVNQKIDKTLRIWFDDSTIYNAFDVTQGNFHVVDQQGGRYMLSSQVERDVNKISLAF